MSRTRPRYPLEIKTIKIGYKFHRQHTTPGSNLVCTLHYKIMVLKSILTGLLSVFFTTQQELSPNRWIVADVIACDNLEPGPPSVGREKSGCENSPISIRLEKTSCYKYYIKRFARLDKRENVWRFVCNIEYPASSWFLSSRRLPYIA